MRAPVKFASVARAPFVVLALLLGLLNVRAELWISEVLFNPPGSNSVPNQYVEIRGTANLPLTNIFFIAIEGDTNGEPGTIQNVFDLSGQCMGGNGFLVLLQNSNHYTVNPNARVLVNTNGPGFGSGQGSSIGHRGRNGDIALPNASVTFMLIQATNAPKPGDDIDGDNDGVLDSVAAANWAILDSVGILDVTGFGDIAYGLINFRRASGPGATATAVAGTVVPLEFTPGYVARNRNTTNWSADAWVGADELFGAPPVWKLNRLFTSPAKVKPLLSHIGGPNFGALALPGVVVSRTVRVTEGAKPAPYYVALSAKATHGLTLEIAAPDAVEVSVDNGRSFGSNRIVKLSGTARKTVLVRTQDDDAAGVPERVLSIAHRIASTGDPLRYPTNGTIVPSTIATVVDDERVVLSEIKANPPGTNDVPYEFVELRGTAGAALSNTFLVCLSGEVLQAGVARPIVDLSAQRLGTNGLLLLVAPGHPYQPLPGTRVVEVPQFGAGDGGLPNGSASFLLVHTTNSITEGDDLDAGDNGNAERLPTDAVIIDSIGWKHGSGVVYARAEIKIAQGTPDAASRYSTNDNRNCGAAWFGGDLVGTNGESLIYDSALVTSNFPVGTTMSPGVLNNTAPQISIPSAYSSVIGDRTSPPVYFTVSDAESPAGSILLTVQSDNTNVVPTSNLLLGGNGADHTLTFRPIGVGYATITITATDGAATTVRTLAYAASADLRGGGAFHTGASDGSAAYAIDARWMFLADDESQVLRLYSRSNSGPAVAAFDFNPFLGLEDLYPDGTPKEVDIEGSTHVGNRLYWIGSHSHAFDAEVRTNRGRIFATDLSGTSSNAVLTYVGRYDYFKGDLLNWDSHGEHGKGNFYYGLFDSSQPGVDPKATNGSGFNIEGLAMAPNSSEVAYVGLRAPLVPPTNRVKALVVVVTNFASLAVSNGAPGSAKFGAPIELNLGGRGIRSIEGNGTNYLIVAGPPGPATGIPPSNFKLYTWTGKPSDPPQERSADLSGLNVEGIVSLPALPWKTNSMVELLSDNGITEFYNDGIQAKHLDVPEFKKCRTDWVALGQIVTPQPFIRAAEVAASSYRLTWHSVAGVKYRIQAKAKLADSWCYLEGEVMADDATAATEVTPTDSQRFFRVIATTSPPVSPDEPAR